jgi:dTDP-4-amino-4,6-dideoxygalactose transaminase
LKGDVITTPFSFIATMSSLVWEGLNPVFVDINEDSLNIDPLKITENITNKTTAILPVHVFGNPCQVDKIEEIGKKHNLKVIYDAAHAFDVQLNARNISNFGDVAVYSFHSTKIFHTIEGGAVVVRNKELFDKALLMRNFGIPNYDQITELGVNFKMNEFQAAMGLCVLEDFNEISLKRKQVYLRYQNALKLTPRLRLQKISEQVEQNYSYFPVIFEDEPKLLAVKNALNEKGIFPRRYFYPSLNEVPYLKTRQSMPVSERVSRCILCLPLFPELESDIQEQIIEIIIKLA